MKTGIEWQVSSLAPSQRLKELGVKQESAFYWIKAEGYTEYLATSKKPPFSVWAEGTQVVSAFTVAELISMLHEVEEKDIVVAWSDDNVADHLAQQLCTKLQNLKENVGSGLTQ